MMLVVLLHQNKGSVVKTIRTLSHLVREGVSNVFLVTFMLLIKEDDTVLLVKTQLDI